MATPEQAEVRSPILLSQFAQQAVEKFLAIPKEERVEDDCYVINSVDEVVRASSVDPLQMMVKLIQESGFSVSETDIEPRGRKTWDELWSHISIRIVNKWVHDHTNIKAEEKRREADFEVKENLRRVEQRMAEHGLV